MTYLGNKLRVLLYFAHSLYEANIKLADSHVNL